MCDSRQPLNGADSACSMCQGSGKVMGGDEYHTCPKCGGWRRINRRIGPPDPDPTSGTPPHREPVNDLRSSALLVFLTYIEEKRRLQRGPPAANAAYFDAIYEVRRYVTELVEPEFYGNPDGSRVVREAS